VGELRRCVRLSPHALWSCWNRSSVARSGCPVPR
jgi:hypothetical protein